MNKNNLKPYPFCGRKGELLGTMICGEYVEFRVRCENIFNCSCTTSRYYNKENAITAWNKGHLYNF